MTAVELCTVLDPITAPTGAGPAAECDPRFAGFVAYTFALQCVGVLVVAWILTMVWKVRP